MARKRLSLAAIEKAESIVSSAISVQRSKVFGLVDSTGNVVKKIYMTHDGVHETNEEPELFCAAKLERMFYPKPYKVIYGGRGSSKTFNVVSYLTESSRFKRKRVACLREIQASIAESSYQEIVDNIYRNGNSEEFRVVEKEITHAGAGSKFFFRGMYRNITTLKGMAGVDVAWVEEAENVSQSSYDVLIPTIRKAGSEIIVTFNPKKDTDATWTQWVEPWHGKMVDGIYEDEDRLIININWQDNYWFTEELMRAMNAMKEVDYERYLWIYEGNFDKKSEEIVFAGKYTVTDFEIQSHWSGPHYGMDFGFSVDPTAMVECWVEDLGGGRKNLYINREAGGVAIEITDTSAVMLNNFPDAKRYRWQADCARPETISHIRREGFDIIGCAKWPGSVEDGITWLRGCDKIYVHTRCVEVAKELSMYSYKVDKMTGNILPDLVDKWNHYIDSLRYALGSFIAQRGGGMLLRKRR